MVGTHVFVAPTFLWNKYPHELFFNEKSFEIWNVPFLYVAWSALLLTYVV